MKLTSGVNFIKVLCTAFTPVGPKSAKKNTSDLTVFFVYSGSVCVKAVRRTLMKLTAGLHLGFAVNRYLNETITRQCKTNGQRQFNLIERKDLFGKEDENMFFCL